MLCNGMKCIPVLILKSQRHPVSQTIFLISINSLFIMYHAMSDKISQYDSLEYLRYMQELRQCVISSRDTVVTMMTSGYITWGTLLVLVTKLYNQTNENGCEGL